MAKEQKQQDKTEAVTSAPVEQAKAKKIIRLKSKQLIGKWWHPAGHVMTVSEAVAQSLADDDKADVLGISES